MSRTDHHTTFRLASQYGRVEHNHATGECIIEDAANRFRWSHQCKKTVKGVEFCTKDKPNYGCWVMTYNYVTKPDGSFVYRDNPITGEIERVLDDEPYTWKRCNGHAAWIRDESIACQCDTWGPRPTCFRYPLDINTRHWNHEKGKGDDIQYSTPKSRRLCTKTATRKAIKEGWDDYYAEQEQQRLDEIVSWHEEQQYKRHLERMEREAEEREYGDLLNSLFADMTPRPARKTLTEPRTTTLPKHLR